MTVIGLLAGYLHFRGSQKSQTQIQKNSIFSEGARPYRRNPFHKMWDLLHAPIDAVRNRFVLNFDPGMATDPLPETTTRGFLAMNE